jgi:hypothetical protein
VFGFGGRKDADVDELLIEQRVQDALSRLQSGLEPGLGVVSASEAAPSSDLEPEGRSAMVGLAAADPTVDYVLEALRADGSTLDRATVARVLTLGREFADKSLH